VRERLLRILKEAKKMVGVNENVRIVLCPMKRKIASISLRTRIIRLNKNVIPKLSDEVIRYLLVHELIHFKIKTLAHNSAFLEELERVYPTEKRQEIENQIIDFLF